MKLHDFTCIQCDNVFEELVFATETHPPCPVCGSRCTKKVLSFTRHMLHSEWKYDSKTGDGFIKKTQEKWGMNK
jgi:putative FmdB family regulatory protein